MIFNTLMFIEPNFIKLPVEEKLEQEMKKGGAYMFTVLWRREEEPICLQCDEWRREEEPIYAYSVMKEGGAYMHTVWLRRK